MLIKKKQICIRICCLLSIIGGNACDLGDIFLCLLMVVVDVRFVR